MCFLNQLLDQPFQITAPFSSASNKISLFLQLAKNSLFFTASGHGDSCDSEEEETLFL